MADNSELDAVYKKTVEKIKPQIEQCLKMAQQGYAEAVRLAEAHGIPFETQVLDRRHSYLPILPEGVSDTAIHDAVGIWTDSDSSGKGWQNSSSSC